VYAGQVCISVQRIFVHQKVYGDFMDALKAEVGKIKTGDPLDPTVITGPVIDEPNKNRILSWISEAKAGGARVVAGEEKSQGNLISPLILDHVPEGCSLAGNEAFAPVAIISSFSGREEIIDRVNASRYGLQCGVFSDSQAFIRSAFEKLEVGGVTVNLAPTFRADNMPYGGVKDSGFGREGLKYAMEEMTERKLLVW
jgi:glyceraldehyde-3-phosphate dehydrogenase (NADP+)